MKPIALALTILFLGGTTLSAETLQSKAAAPFPGRQFEHVLIIVLENEDQKDVLKNCYMRKLAEAGRLFTNFNGVAHPSYPNYLAMVAGTSFGIHGPFGDNQKTFDTSTIADLLEAQHLTWTQYAENYPGGPDHCFLAKHSPDAQRLYQRKHMPFLSFKSIQTTNRCSNVVGVSPGSFDAHRLPSYSFFTPNMRNDGHDTSLEAAATWLEGFLEPIRTDPSVMKDTLIVVTFDESETRSSNHIYTVFLGDMVKKGTVDPMRRDHYSVLRTIEENFALGTLGAKDEKADPISDAWNGEL
ncbi:MAG TPA: alkaline phosphatase family protein [Thermoanaerobaculia bacterium]|jgi:hypothetical protein|nr:alkaline phosphatase family protein [Thermoanaerobaculia bacterium]